LLSIHSSAAAAYAGATSECSHQSSIGGQRVGGTAVDRLHGQQQLLLARLAGASIKDWGWQVL